MMQHHLSCWPLVVSIASGEPDLQELRDYSSAWTSWLDRGKPFVMLKIFLDGSAHTHPPGAAQEEKRWLADNRNRFQQQVLGMATVAPANVLEKIQKMKTERLFGVSAQAFATADAALDWLLPLLHAHVPDVDVHTLKVRALQQCLHIPTRQDPH